MLRKHPKVGEGKAAASHHSLGSPSFGPALTILPTSPANVTPLLARCSWEPVLLPLREFLRMMPGSREGEL